MGDLDILLVSLSNGHIFGRQVVATNQNQRNEKVTNKVDALVGSPGLGQFQKIKSNHGIVQGH
jgi:hypothetical protein